MMGLPSVYCSCAHKLYSMHRIHISLDAFLEYASREGMCIVSLEPPSFVSLPFFDFLVFFGVSFVNLSLEMLHTFLFLFGSRFAYFLQGLRCSFFKAFLTGVTVRMTVVFFILFTF